jgi:hypothetical protein
MDSNVQFRARYATVSWVHSSWGRSTGAPVIRAAAGLGEPIELSGGGPRSHHSPPGSDAVRPPRRFFRNCGRSPPSPWSSGRSRSGPIGRHWTDIGADRLRARLGFGDYYRTAYASALLKRIALFASNRVSIPGRHHSPPKKLTGLSALSFPEGVLLPVRLGSPVSERGEAVAQ